MKPAALILTGVLLAGTAGAAETPGQIHDRNLTCAAAAAAGRTEFRDKPEDQQKANDLADRTMAIAQASGPGAGMTSGQVALEVASRRDAILDGLAAKDPTKAEQEKSALGKIILDCAIVQSHSN